MSVRVEHIGDATLYLGDARDIVPTLDGVDLVVTSPPYNQLRRARMTYFTAPHRPFNHRWVSPAEHQGQRNDRLSR